MTVTAPTSLADALAALADEPGSLVLAGGTDLMVQVNEGLRRPGPAPVLALAGVPELRAVRREGDDLVVGAGVTYTELMGEPVASLAPALAQAARTVGSPQIRNAGTIGGNLGTASPAGDTLPVLVALERGRRAGERDRCPRGARRRVPHRARSAPRSTPGELIVAVRIPVRRGPQEYLKVGVRNAMVIAVASAGAGRRRSTRGRWASGSARSGRPHSRAPEPRARGSTAQTGLAPTSRGRRRVRRRVVAAPLARSTTTASTAAYRRHAVGVLAATSTAQVRRMTPRARELHAARQRRRPRGRATRGSARACSTCCASGSVSRRRRRAASRVSAVRARCSSTARWCARAWCSRRRCRRPRDRHPRGPAARRAGALTDVQQAFVDEGAVQCGFCTPGLVMAVHDLLDARPRARPTSRSARRCRGNLCRCTGYGRILAAVARRGRRAGEAAS